MSRVASASAPPCSFIAQLQPAALTITASTSDSAAKALSLLARKVEAIRKLAPDVVATGNPGCLMQLGAGLREAGLEIAVRHPVELLADAYARPTG